MFDFSFKFKDIILVTICDAWTWTLPGGICFGWNPFQMRDEKSGRSNFVQSAAIVYNLNNFEHFFLHLFYISLFYFILNEINMSNNNLLVVRIDFILCSIIIY